MSDSRSSRRRWRGPDEILLLRDDEVPPAPFEELARTVNPVSSAAENRGEAVSALRRAARKFGGNALVCVRDSGGRDVHVLTGLPAVLGAPVTGGQGKTLQQMTQRLREPDAEAMKAWRETLTAASRREANVKFLRAVVIGAGLLFIVFVFWGLASGQLGGV